MWKTEFTDQMDLYSWSIFNPRVHLILFNGNFGLMFLLETSLSLHTSENYL